MPLRGNDARRLLRRLILDGIIEFIDHARDEMRKDGLTDVDVVNVLRAGVTEDPEGCRYRVRSNKIALIVEIEPDFDAMPDGSEDLSEVTLKVITAWKTRT